MQVELKNGKIGELETEIADSAKSLQESAQYREQIVNFENMLKSHCSNKDNAGAINPLPATRLLGSKPV